jgi:p-aminobenzoyl-glutamate transporter AbgT
LRRSLNILPVILLLLIVIVAVISWIANVYGANCRNILSSEGMRWTVEMIMDNFNRSPWTYIVVGLASLSMIVESGIISGFSKQKYLRQRRAYMLVAVVMAVIAALALILYLLPGNSLLSAFGTFNNSALQRGLFPIIAVLLYMLSLIYAFAIGRFNDIEDVIKATVNITVRIPGYFITLFVASQLIAVILYSFFIDYNLSLPMPTSVKILAVILYGIPLILHLLTLKQKQ